jgi:hypothetical protein
MFHRVRPLSRSRIDIPANQRWRRMSKLNYRRGFQRVWILLSLLWMGYFIVVSLGDRPKLTDLHNEGKGQRATLVYVDPSEIQPVVGWSDVVKFWSAVSAIAVVPPVIGYAFLFWIWPWVARGFIRSESAN